VETVVLHCDCGFEAKAADENELVAEVQRHAREAHGMALSDDEALLLAFRAELREQDPPTATPPRHATEGGAT
jgi:predicted small metal-binding protein